MIYYLVCALLFIFYLELSGQYLAYKFNIRTLKLNFGFGLLAFLAYSYLTTSIMGELGCSFYLVLFIYFLYIFAIIVLIIKDFKKVNWKFDYDGFLLAFIFVGVMLYYAYKTSLGDRSGFDSTHYLNLIATNIKNSHLNSTSLYYGVNGIRDVSTQYTFQTYYYLSSCLTFVFTKLISLFTNTSYYLVIIWCLQIIYDFFLFSLVYNSINYFCSKYKLLSLLIIYIFLFFYGKIYFINVYGFYGNTFRPVAISYLILFLHDLLSNIERKKWYSFAIAAYGACAFSSSSIFMLLLLLFGIFFVLVDKEDNIFKYFSLILLMPLINLFSILISNIIVSVLISFVICLLLYFLNNKLVYLSRLKYSKAILLILSTMLMFIGSYFVTGNILDFNAFFNNLSESADMTIDYFKFNTLLGKSKPIYCLLILISLLYAITFEHNNDLIKIFIILIIVFLNPFCCSLLNKVVIVYYRAYDLIINPFSLILFLNLFFRRFTNKCFYYGVVSFLLIVFILNTAFLVPAYYHSTFLPNDNYNPLYKMQSNEYEIVAYIKEDAISRGINNPYIITPNLFTESIIPNGKFIYARELVINPLWNDAELNLYNIFYPSRYLGDYSTGIKNYDDIAKYLKEAKIDYLVVDKKQEYYDERKDYYGFLLYKVAECDYGNSIYNNERYELFYFEKN